MRGFHNNSFDPQTLVVLEAAFDEAWLTLKAIGNTTVKPDELAVAERAAGFGMRLFAQAKGSLLRHEKLIEFIHRPISVP